MQGARLRVFLETAGFLQNPPFWRQIRFVAISLSKQLSGKAYYFPGAGKGKLLHLGYGKN
ncbi:MAG: hypothetical protein C5B47_04840 [Verrucomicrobia bacterium]|nr:MAG: hypothetical protein C5B47_04840 [Verrucomicrobiota bacterium]